MVEFASSVPFRILIVFPAVRILSIASEQKPTKLGRHGSILCRTMGDPSQQCRCGGFATLDSRVHVETVAFCRCRPYELGKSCLRYGYAAQVKQVLANPIKTDHARSLVLFLHHLLEPFYNRNDVQETEIWTVLKKKSNYSIHSETDSIDERTGPKVCCRFVK